MFEEEEEEDDNGEEEKGEDELVSGDEVLELSEYWVELNPLTIPKPPTPQQQTGSTTAQTTSKVQHSPEKKQTQTKKEVVVKQEKPVVPNASFLGTMKMMGFDEEASKQALVKVKNESVEAAVEAIQDIMEELDKEKAANPMPVKEYQYLQWQCLICTFINEKTGICQVCGGGAPEEAKLELFTPEQILD